MGITTAILSFLLVGHLSGQEASTPPLFTSDDPLALTLAADFSLLKGDRRGETPERPAVVTLAGDAGAEVAIEAALRTRGNFRREAANCHLPPLRLDLKTQQTVGTAFEGQDKLKIVGSCRPERDSYEQLVLKEYLAYRIYQLLTDRSFRTRLARITYVDESGEDEPFTRFAFFIEDDDALAERLGGVIFELAEGKNLPIEAFDGLAAARNAIFQYMIGSTDWSEVAAHNVEIVDRGGAALVVPYDFDFSGLVDAPYANPDPDLPLGSVRERYYQGWCWGPSDTRAALEGFRSVRTGVLALLQTLPWLEDGERSRILRYLGAFFDEIRTDDVARARFLRDCRPTVG